MSFENIKIALAENSLATETALEEFFKGKNSSGSLEIIISAETVSARQKVNTKRKSL